MFSSNKEKDKELQAKINQPFQQEKTNQKTNIPPNNTSTSSSTAQSTTTKKPFNIQLSEDDKDMYNLNNDDDIEIEDEEEEIEEQISPDKKASTCQSNTNVDDQLSSSRSNCIPVYIEQQKPSKKMREDPNTYCHRIRKKQMFFSLEEVTSFPIIKRKEKTTLLSSFGFVDSKIIEMKYVVFLEENYMYFAKDIPIDKHPNILYRKLGNKYSLKTIQNIDFQKDSDEHMYCSLSFSDNIEPLNIIYKEFFMPMDKVDLFIDELKRKLNTVGVIVNEETNEDNDDNEDDNEEGVNKNEEVVNKNEEDLDEDIIDITKPKNPIATLVDES